MNKYFFLYLVVMAGITYLIRMLPLVLIKDKITNRFLLSFLHYIPYAVLSVMTIPAIFYSTSYVLSAAIGFIVAIVLAHRQKSLLTVASLAALAVFITETVLKLI